METRTDIKKWCQKFTIDWNSFTYFHHNIIIKVAKDIVTAVDKSLFLTLFNLLLCMMKLLD